MYLKCNNCGYEIDTKSYHAGQKCSKCGMGVMQESNLTESFRRNLRRLRTFFILLKGEI